MTEGFQFGHLRHLSLPQRAYVRIELQLGCGAAASFRWQPGEYLDKVLFPPARSLHKAGRDALQQALRRQGSRSRRGQHRSAGSAEQLTRRRHRYGACCIDEVHPPAGQPGNGMCDAANVHHVADSEAGRLGDSHDGTPATVTSDAPLNGAHARSARSM